VLFLVARRRRRPKVYVSDRIRPVSQERGANRDPNRIPTPGPTRGGNGRSKVALALGSVTAFASAIFVVRAVYRIGVWVFSLHLGGAGWLIVNAVLAGVLGAVAWTRWSHSRLVFGATLLLAALWANLVYLPPVRAAAELYGDHRFAFVQVEAVHLTSVILLLIAVGALYSYPGVRRFVQSRLTS
jgi:hypothetical protein